MEPIRDLAETRARFRADRFATEQAGITIESAGLGEAVCRMVVTPQHRNAAGQVMGGAIFTLADFCFAVAANAGPLTVSLSSQIHFLAPAKGDALVATAKADRAGKRVCFYTVEIADNLGTAVAKVMVTGAVVGNS